MQARFLITTLGGEDMILGLPWLQKENPEINWEKNEIHLKEDTVVSRMLTLECAIHLRMQPHVEEVEEEQDEEFYDTLDEELWDPGTDSQPRGETPNLLPCEEDEDEDLEEVLVSYCKGERLLRRLDFKTPLTHEHIPPTFMFKTRNQTVSKVPNLARFIFNPALAM
jgi:hypothetical protein